MTGGPNLVTPVKCVLLIGFGCDRLRNHIVRYVHVLPQYSSAIRRRTCNGILNYLFPFVVVWPWACSNHATVLQTQLPSTPPSHTHTRSCSACIRVRHATLHGYCHVAEKYTFCIRTYVIHILNLLCSIK